MHTYIHMLAGALLDPHTQQQVLSTLFAGIALSLLTLTLSHSLLSYVNVVYRYGSLFFSHSLLRSLLTLSSSLFSRTLSYFLFSHSDTDTHTRTHTYKHTAIVFSTLVISVVFYVLSLLTLSSSLSLLRSSFFSHTDTQTHRDWHSDTQTLRHTETHTHTYTHTHTHTRTHTAIVFSTLVISVVFYVLSLLTLSSSLSLLRSSFFALLTLSLLTLRHRDKGEIMVGWKING